jgi:Mn-dependent DtxR family transcriptional regulator
MLSVFDKKSKDEAKEIDWGSEENTKMLSALEQLGLVEKKRKGYVLSQRGRNILNYFNNSKNRGEPQIIGKE